MNEKVYHLWHKIGQHVQLVPDIQVLESIRETSRRSYTLHGFQSFKTIKGVIDSEISECSDVNTLEAFFKEGPGSDPSLTHIYKGLSNMNEYSNTVNYLHCKAIERLDQLGKKGKKVLGKLSKKHDGFKGSVYFVNGGRGGADCSDTPEVVFLEQVVQEVLQ